jgi:hypothetical protein
MQHTERKQNPAQPYTNLDDFSLVMFKTIYEMYVRTREKGCQQLNCADEVAGSYMVHSTSVHFEDIQGTALCGAKRGLTGEF